MKELDILYTAFRRVGFADQATDPGLGCQEIRGIAFRNSAQDYLDHSSRSAAFASYLVGE
jgi:hypothetical protein